MGGRLQRAQDLRQLAGGELARSTGAVAELREATEGHPATLRPATDRTAPQHHRCAPGAPVSVR